MVRVEAPYDGTFIEELPLTTHEEAFSHLECAYTLYRDRKRWLSAIERRKILQRLRDQITDQKESFALEAAREGGKPLIDSRIEVERGIQGIEWAIGELDRLTGEQVPMGSTDSSQNKWAFTLREPRGVLFAVSAFNHPFNLIVHQVVTAVAVGCPVLIKPAKATPLTCRSLLNELYAAGLPKEWATMILCDHKTTETLVADPRIAFLSFIGSAAIGWRLRSLLAPGADCTLEHGGSAPVLLLDDCDEESLLPRIVKGGYYHAGQVCVSVQRLFAPHRRAQDIAHHLAERAKRLIVGDPTREESEVGPLIRPSEVDRVHEWVEESGVTPLCGGTKLSPSCYAPTVLLNPSEKTRISKKELFGPVICVYGYDSLEEAIRRANALPFSFQASVFGQKLDPLLYAVQQLDAMAVMVNEQTAFRVDWMPFGGSRESGLGVGGIPYEMRDLTREKLVVIHSPSICP